ncbi:MAG: MerR family transcriptional regulator [Bacteroidales bacterium]|nr:MerR family transcriptional regulator [Bacteroidales bacterium]MDD4669514.1 MerR family transcriptional regulator [Bacteroidales bacterium]
MKEDILQEGRLYYTMGEVSAMLGENTSLVRFWAEQFPKFIKPARNNKGNRLFTPSDVSNFKIIYHLVKEQGLTLEGARKRMTDNKEGTDHRVEIIDKLKEIKECLLQVHDNL